MCGEVVIHRIITMLSVLNNPVYSSHFGCSQITISKWSWRAGGEITGRSPVTLWLALESKLNRGVYLFRSLSGSRIFPANAAQLHTLDRCECSFSGQYKIIRAFESHLTCHHRIGMRKNKFFCMSLPLPAGVSVGVASGQRHKPHSHRRKPQLWFGSSPPMTFTVVYFLSQTLGELKFSAGDRRCL